MLHMLYIQQSTIPSISDANDGCHVGTHFLCAVPTSFELTHMAICVLMHARSFLYPLSVMQPLCKACYTKVQSMLYSEYGRRCMVARRLIAKPDGDIQDIMPSFTIPNINMCMCNIRVVMDVGVEFGPLQGTTTTRGQWT